MSKQIKQKFSLTQTANMRELLHNEKVKSSRVAQLKLRSPRDNDYQFESNEDNDGRTSRRIGFDPFQGSQFQRPKRRLTKIDMTNGHDTHSHRDLSDRMDNIHQQVTGKHHPHARHEPETAEHNAIQSNNAGYGEPEEALEAPKEAGEGGGEAPGAGTLGTIIDGGLKVYNAVQDQRAAAKGMNRYQLYGGESHPKGQPMGLSAMNANDKAAVSRMQGENALGGLLKTAVNGAASVADMAFEGDTPDAVTLIENQIENLMIPLDASHSTTDTNWTYEKRASRKILLAQVPWNPAGLAFKYNVHNAFNEIPELATLLRSYRYFKYDSYTVTVHYETNGFYAGIGRMYFMPSWSGVSFPLTDARPKFSGRGVEFFANQNTEVSMTIPWHAPIGQISTSVLDETSDEYYFGGTIFLGSLSPLVVPENASSAINLQITIQINGLKLRLPTMDQVPAPTNLEHQGDYTFDIYDFNKSLVNELYRRNSFYRDLLREANTWEDLPLLKARLANLDSEFDSRLRVTYKLTREYGFLSHTLPSPIFGTPRELYEHLKVLENFFPHAQRVLNSWKSEHRDKALEVVRSLKNERSDLKQIRAIIKNKIDPYVPNADENNNNPNLETAQPDLEHQGDEANTTVFYYPTTNKMQGGYSTTRLAGKYSTIEPLVGATSIAEMSSIWTYYQHGKFTWEVQSSAELVRIGGAVQPLQFLDDPAGAGNMIDYLGLFGAHWSGTFDFKLQFSKSAFHQGKLLVCYVPPGLGTYPSNLAEMTQFPYVIIDISQQNEFIIKMPNNNMRPMRFVNGQYTTLENSSIGTLIFRPFSPLVATTNVATNIECIMWIRGHQSADGDQFRLYNPVNISRLNRATNELVDPPANDLEHQSGIITFSEDTASAPIVHGFEEIVDLTQLTQRTQPHVIQANTYPGVGGVKNFMPIGYSGHLNVATSQHLPYPMNYMELIAPCFTMWYGDADVMVKTDADITITRQLPTPAGNGIGDGNCSFGAGPGMVRFQNAITMTTCKLSPYTINDFLLFSPDFIYGGDPNTYRDNPYVTAGQLVIDSYHSDTLRGAAEALLYFSTSNNFTMSGYNCLPAGGQILAVMGTCDLNAKSFFQPPTFEKASVTDLQHESDRRQEPTLQYRPPQQNQTVHEQYADDDFIIHGSNSADEDTDADDEPPSRRFFRLRGRYPNPNELLVYSRGRDRRRPGRAALRRQWREESIRVREARAEYEARREEFEREQAARNERTGFFSEIRNLPSRISNAASSMDLAGRAYAGVADRVHATMDNVEDITNNLQGFIARFTNIDPADVTVACIMVIDFFETIYINSKPKWAGFLLKLGTILGLRSGMLETAYASLQTYMSPNQLNEGNDMEHQMDMTPQTIATMLSVVVMAIGMKSTGALNEKKNATLWEQMAVRGREAHGIKMGLGAFMEGFSIIQESIVDGLITYVYEDDPELKKTYGSKPLARELATISGMMKEMHEFDNLKLISYVPEKRAKFKDIFNRMNAVRHKITTEGDRETRTMYMTMKSTFEDLISATMDNSPNFEVRIDPPHYCIVGDPGIGKSSVSTALAKAILLSQGQPVKNNIYCRTEASKFHDNYCHQYVYQIDDGGMTQDPEKAMEAIQRKSNVPYPLVMADLGKKGMFFTSKCLITTSNTMYPKVPGITCNDALLRRRDVLIKATWAPSHARSQVKEADFSHMQFSLHYPTDHQREHRPIRTGMTIRDLVHYIIVFHGKHLTDQTRFVRGIQPDLELEKVYQYSEAHEAKMDTIFDKVIADMTNASIEVNEYLLNANSLEFQGAAMAYGNNIPDDDEPSDSEDELETPINPEESNVLTIQYQRIGIRSVNGEMYIYGISNNTEYRYMHPDDPTALAIMEELERQHIAAARELQELFREHSNSHQAFSNALHAAIVAPRSRWDRFKEGMRNIGLLTFDLFFTSQIPLTPLVASTSPFFSGIYQRTEQRLIAVENYINFQERRLWNAMTNSDRLYYMYFRFFVMFPVYAGAVMSIIMRKIMDYSYRAAYAVTRWILSRNIWVKILIGSLGVGYIIYRLTRKDNTSAVKSNQETYNLIHEDDTLRIQDHHHIDLPDDGKRYVHAHMCTKCNMVFTHTHKKNPYEVSVKYDQLCQKCYRKKLRKVEIDYMDHKQVEIPRSEDDTEHESVTANSSAKPRTNVVRLESSTAMKLEPGRTITLDEARLEIAKQLDLKHEGSVDSNALDIATKIFPNQGEIWCGTRHMNYLGLYGRTIAVPAHLLLPLKPATDITIKRLNMHYKLTIYKSQIKTRVLPGNPDVPDEFVVLDLTDYPQVPSFVDIRSLFVSERDIGKIAGSKVCLQRRTEDGTRFIRQSLNTKLIGETVIQDSVISGFARGIEYNMPTSKGDCGAVLYILNKDIAGKLLGVHVSGSRSQDIGYSVLITQEMINSVEMKFQCASAPPVEYLHTIVDVIPPEDYPSYAPGGFHMVLGRLKTRQIASPLKSDIIPSPLFDRVFTHTTEPVCLTGSDPRNTTGISPMVECVKKFDNQAGQWDYIDRVTSREHSFKELLIYTKDYTGPRHILTMDEAINGIPGFIEPLNMRTSPGYPFILDKKSNQIGKTSFFDQSKIDDNGKIYYQPKPELAAAIDKIITTAQTEKWCIDNYYMDWLKDERRKIEKVRLGKTRMFNIHNMAWVIVMRRYFGSALAAYHHASIHNGSTIGINMHGSDVTRLIRHLNEAGKNWWDLDISNFDGTADYEGIHDAFYVFKNYMRHYNTIGHELDVFADSMFWRIHVLGTIAYIPFIGIPSGHLFTSVCDTEVNKQRRNKAWRSLMKRYNRMDLISLDVKSKLARETGNGDDILGAVNDAVKDIYNPQNISEFWASHGITSTPPTKEEGGTVGGFRVWDKVTYLKCHFARHEDYGAFYVARMNIDTIRELANWIRTSSDDMYMLRSNISDMERFLYTHGRASYYENLTKVQTALREIGEDYIVTPYEYYQEQWQNEHQI